MKYSVKKFTALLLALIMVLSLAPLDAIASVFTTYEAKIVIDTSESVQISDTIATSRIESANVVVTSLDPILPVEGRVEFEQKPVEKPKLMMKATRGVAASVPTTRTVGRFDITIIDDATKAEWQPRKA